MPKCPNCEAEHPENTLFCDECGAYLLRDVQKETGTLVVTQVTRTEKEKASEVPGDEVTLPLYVKLTIPDSGRDMEVPFEKGVTIGRLDPANASFPEVDLTDDGGLDKGVSRRHARITRRGKEVCIEDLGSINGTFLNGKKLVPYLPHALRGGDELQLGQLTLQVSFVH